MKIPALLLVTFGCVAGAFAQSETYLYPSTPFDYAATAAQLAPGTGTIQGVAYKDTPRKRLGGLLKKPPVVDYGTRVVLYPLTPYFEEFLVLREKTTMPDFSKKGGKFKASLDEAIALRKKYPGGAALSNEAFSCRIVTWVREDGRFEFTQLKPGKYRLEVIFADLGAEVKREQTGEQQVTITDGKGNVTGGYTVPIYTDFVTQFDITQSASDTVEIKAEGATVKSTLAPKL